MNMKINKSYKYRIYPTEEQQANLWFDINAARSVWNHMLFAQKISFEASKTFIDFHKSLTELKDLEEFSYFNDVSERTLLTLKLRHLETAYKNFFNNIKKGKSFKQAGFPKFKSSKFPVQSVSYQLDTRTIIKQIEASKEPTIFNPGEWIKPNKKLGRIHFKWTQIPKGIPKMITISHKSDKTWWLSFSCEEEVDTSEFTANGNSVGIDFGVQMFATLSNGLQFNAPLPLAKAKAKLAKEQRALKRKVKNSNRYNRQKLKVAKLHSSIANKRTDYVHKFTNMITNNFDVIMIETLDVQSMTKKFGKHFNRKLSDVSIYETTRQLEYKSDWKGKTLVKIDKWFPSTKICNSCGTIHNMPLSQRFMTCDCGNIMNRDYNASINIRTEGLRSLDVDTLNTLRTEQFRLDDVQVIEASKILSTKVSCLEQLLCA